MNTTYVVNAVVFILSFVGMEAVAWFAHKYLMHGFLWHLHKDHHKKDHYGFFEKNDYFFLIFAIPGILCLLIGLGAGYHVAFWVGMGITVYGLAYFFVHEIFIHQRFRYLRHTDNAYFQAIRRAHKIHHKKIDKEGGECFGMLWVPLKYFRSRSSQ